MEGGGRARGLALPWRDRPRDEEPRAARATTSRGRRIARRLGTALLVLGFLFIAYGATVYFWRDPVTDIYARWKQHQLAAQLEESFQQFQISVEAEDPKALEPILPTTTGVDQALPSADAEAAAAAVARAERLVARNARKLEATLVLGQPLGRIVIPRLGVDPVFVHGTRWGADLSRGPGHYPETSVPGLGKVTAIAGHRTTFGAWFRNIDDLEAGDPIDVVLPYGTFHYRVIGHEIVDNGDWSIIEPKGFDELVLSACHPLYSASHRWIVYARLVRVDVGDGVSYAVPAPNGSAASS